MKLLLAAIFVIIALLLLTRRKQPPQNPGTVAPPVPRPELAKVGAAVTAAEADDLNRAARERRQSALCARWWSV